MCDYDADDYDFDDDLDDPFDYGADIDEDMDFGD